jgi:hypothetical protein
MDVPRLLSTIRLMENDMKEKDISKKRRESRKAKQFMRDTMIPFNTQLSLPFMESKNEKKRRK